MNENNLTKPARKTVSKAMQLLHAFTNNEPEMSLTVLSTKLGMHKSVASRLVASLCEWRMLERNPDTKQIRLGMGVLLLGMQVANQNTLHRLALPLLGKLVEKTRHSAHVSILDNAEMLVIATVQSPEALRVILQLGDRRPLHATAGGKVILANLPEKKMMTLINEKKLLKLTNTTLTSMKDLRNGLDEIRFSGSAWNNGESVLGVGAVASGIFDASGLIVGAVSSVFPLNTVTKAQYPLLAAEVRKTANELSAALGWKISIQIKKGG